MATKFLSLYLLVVASLLVRTVKAAPLTLDQRDEVGTNIAGRAPGSVSNPSDVPAKRAGPVNVGQSRGHFYELYESLGSSGEAPEKRQDPAQGGYGSMGQVPNPNKRQDPAQGGYGSMGQVPNPNKRQDPSEGWVQWA